jgi:GT2 family glycosyltransferase
VAASDSSRGRQTLLGLLTSHERRDHTLAALEALFSQDPQGHEVRAILVDAGSTDGTAAAVEAAFPATEVIRVGRDIFWNQGMRVALDRARDADPDQYLWLNDDTTLDDRALEILLRTEREMRRRTSAGGAVVGTTRDPVTGVPTYGGVRRRQRWRPMLFDLVAPGETPRWAETMHGNCVLIPRDVVAAVGNLEARYTHAMGDLDYGLRIRSAGMEVWVAPGTVGTCARNPTPARSSRAELRHLASPKGLPPREWALFVRRWAGPLWPIYFASPYVRRTARSLFRGRLRHDAPSGATRQRR